MFENYESGIPFYLQIIDKMQDTIRQGRLIAGSKISIRKIMQQFNASRNTVERAFMLLKEQGIVDTIPKSGTIITKEAWGIVNRNAPDWNRINSQGYYMASRELSNKIILRRTQAEKLMYTQSYTFFEKDFQPYAQIDDMIRDIPSGYLFELPDNKLLREAQQAVVEYVKKYGIQTKAANVHLFTSYSHAINGIVLSIFRNGANLYRMKPDLFGSARLFTTIGAHTHVLQHDSEGICPDDLNRKLNNARYNVMASTPVNHLPTGITISEKRREELLDILWRYNTPVLENGTLRNLWLTPPPPPLKSDDKFDQMIFVNSFDYAALTGPTWVIAPEAMIKRLQDVSLQIYSLLNAFTCQIIIRMLNSGLYEEIMGNIRRVNALRLPLIEKMLEKNLKHIAQWHPDRINFNLALQFDDRVNVTKLFDDCNTIMFEPGEQYHDASYAILNSVCESVENTEKALSQIAEHAKKQLR